MPLSCIILVKPTLHSIEHSVSGFNNRVDYSSILDTIFAITSYNVACMIGPCWLVSHGRRKKLDLPLYFIIVIENVINCTV
jgi:hypothetical protein